MTLEATQGLATSTNDIIYAPSFSHTLKDPTENSIAIHPNHKIVIVEGLYTFLGIDPWKEAAEALDERWFVDIDETQARERLIRRHVATGVAKNSEEAIWRADSNDLPSERALCSQCRNKHRNFFPLQMGVLSRRICSRPPESYTVSMIRYWPLMGVLNDSYDQSTSGQH